MPRAKPLPLEERRAAIIEAATPVLLDKGPAFTTREVAEAAGIAEGTLFRAFNTREELLWAVADHMFDPTPTCREIADLPERGNLESLVTDVCATLNAQIHEITRVMTALHTQRELLRPPSDPRSATEHRQRAERAKGRQIQLLDAVAARLQPYADQLRVSPLQAATVITAFAMTNHHPVLTEMHLPPDRLADIIVHGLAGPSEQTR